MVKIILAVVLLALCFPDGSVYGDKLESYTDMVRDGAGKFQVGSPIKLPDGSSSVIEEILPNGYFRARGGYVFSPDGIITEGDWAGLPAILDSGSSDANSQVDINSPITIETPAAASAVPGVIAPGGVVSGQGADASGQEGGLGGTGALVPGRGDEAPAVGGAGQGGGAWRKPKTGAKTAEGVEPRWRQVKPGAATVGKPAGGRSVGSAGDFPDKAAEGAPGMTVADLIPTTRTPVGGGGGQAAPAKASPAEKPGKEPAAAGVGKGDGKGGAPAKGVGKGDGKGVGKGGASGKAGAGTPPGNKPDANSGKSAKSAGKPKAGQALRIPPEAVKTGDLSFLEGCWQGTRPEYFSKRTIKECFCFNSGGKTGKRWVNDFSYGRNCIGAARATMSGNGVLSVRSDGAACSDGERWGRADMVCRNSGQNTPCSWVFGDAGNGTQSYQIPFVRVESCRR